MGKSISVASVVYICNVPTIKSASEELMEIRIFKVTKKPKWLKLNLASLEKLVKESKGSNCQYSHSFLHSAHLDTNSLRRFTSSMKIACFLKLYTQENTDQKG